ncbi:Gfo/Idh/MocA family protein [Actinokineospora cianjurensis]|uniref:Putative dehydrogenase n=1 Tax=Actinokineospora cianjurensis TaxID=585224 RepID=A0A421B2B4_9PSEU|nr:Gfo/Idh/MocA family oxidoreductase [Actinokineospora cianjurensis]RLK58507.1 putative dehydrogenase [Actinokineospora cianjurensis]
MARDRVRVAVVGAGRWARRAHIPGWSRDPRAEVVALVDTDRDALAGAGRDFGIDRLTTDYREVLDDPTIDVVDVATANTAHFEISEAALVAGKHVLCEKPVHRDYRETRRLSALAKANGLKTKLGFTFRYAPAVQYAKRLIDEGFVGEPYLFNGFEQNSQWIDPRTPMRQVDPDADPDVLAVSSIEGYGAPIIDIMHWWAGSELTSVVGTMRNFVPERVVASTGRSQRLNIDDGDMWICEFGPGLLASIQSSYVAVGNLPGIEARVYGSAGAVIIRLVAEHGTCQSIRTATKDAVEFVEREIPREFFPEGGTSREDWDSLFYANLCADFVGELLDGTPANQGDFGQGALVQETINAFEAAHRTRAWVDFPLGGAA